MNTQPRLIKGSLAVDDRGELAFINELDLIDVRRFYLVRNYEARYVRAWHAHRTEGKYVTVLSGAALLCCVEVDDWESPSRDLPVHRFVLSARQPSALAIPPAFANGSMSLTDDCTVLFFSTHSIEDSLGDDIRYPSRHWDPWSIEER